MHGCFSGLYLKCQSPTQTLSVIPAVHGGSRSVQLITDSGAWSVAGCIAALGRDGFALNIHTDKLSAVGEVRFGKLSPLRYDIMGTFRYVPFMECRHSVVSMRHSVNGKILVNGTGYKFENALGYIEGDCGRSFPRRYVWTQSFFDGGSLMLSAADIPLAGLRFTGVICAVLLHGREYRLATYLGARAEKSKTAKLLSGRAGMFSPPRCLKNARRR